MVILQTDYEKNWADHVHFSVMMNAVKKKRSAICVAGNIVGTENRVKVDRKKWTRDPNYEKVENCQIERKYYDRQEINGQKVENYWDEGHLIQRHQISWGSKAKEASDGSFVYTNGVLQHVSVNDDEVGGVESIIELLADKRGKKASVFTGPIYLKDLEFPAAEVHGVYEPGPLTLQNLKPVLIPNAFYHVAFYLVKGELRAFAFVSHQNKETIGEYAGHNWSGAYWVPLKKIEDLTGLKFDEELVKVGVFPEGLEREILVLQIEDVVECLDENDRIADKKLSSLLGKVVVSGAMLKDEQYVQLKNVSEQEVTIEGFTIKINEKEVKRGGSVTLKSGEVHEVKGLGFKLKTNESVEFALRDKEEKLIDRAKYSNSGSKSALARDGFVPMHASKP